MILFDSNLFLAQASPNRVLRLTIPDRGSVSIGLGESANIPYPGIKKLVIMDLPPLLLNDGVSEFFFNFTFLFQATPQN